VLSPKSVAFQLLADLVISRAFSFLREITRP